MESNYPPEVPKLVIICLLVRSALLVVKVNKSRELLASTQKKAPQEKLFLSLFSAISVAFFHKLCYATFRGLNASVGREQASTTAKCYEDT